MTDLLNKKVRPQSLVDAVTERLEEAIISGVCAPGSKLSEQALAKSLGVSRAPLREAIRRLEGRKLLQRTPNIGVRVATLSASDMTEIIQVHEALQGMACALAAKNMTDAEIESMKELLTEHEKQLESPNDKGRDREPKDFDLDLEFHFRIVTGSRNKRLSDMLFEDLSYILWGNRFISTARSGRWAQALEEHRGIIAALASRDEDAAERRMREHIRNDRLYMEEQLVAAEENGSTPPRGEPVTLPLSRVRKESGAGQEPSRLTREVFGKIT